MNEVISAAPGSRAGDDSKRHRQIHRRFLNSVLGIVISLPVVTTLWLYARVAVCWGPGSALLSLLFCGTPLVPFGVYCLVVVTALRLVHSPVALELEQLATQVAVQVVRIPLHGVLRSSRSRRAYRAGFLRLDPHTRKTLWFAELLALAVIAICLLAVWAFPALVQ
jgi:hypothetical protein